MLRGVTVNRAQTYLDCAPATGKTFVVNPGIPEEIQGRS